MAFLDNKNPPTVAGNVAALRAASTAGLDANSWAFVEAHGATAAMRFNPQDGAVDDPEGGIIVPTDRVNVDPDPVIPGRWRFSHWV